MSSGTPAFRIKLMAALAIFVAAALIVVIRPAAETGTISGFRLGLPASGLSTQNQAPPAKEPAQISQPRILPWGADILAGSWAPPEIDSAAPPVSTDSPCPLSNILEMAGREGETLAKNLQSFSASELVEQEEVGSEGKVRMKRFGKFEYYAAVWTTKEGWLNVDEDRLKGRWSPSAFDKAGFTLESWGIAAHGLVFHSQSLKNYEVRCEGMSRHRDRPVWVLQFEQRPDRPKRTRGYFVQGKTMLVGLKGRAWVDAETGEILRIATDLVAPLEEIRLRRDHIIVEYHRVEFPKRSVVLHLPQQAEMYMDFRGHKMRERHTYSDYVLFWVETQHTIMLPKEP